MRDAQLPADVAVGDILATPVTGAYGALDGVQLQQGAAPGGRVRARRRAPGVVVRRETDRRPRSARDVHDVTPPVTDRRDWCAMDDDGSVRVGHPRLRQRRRRARAACIARPRRPDRGRAPACALEVARVAVHNLTKDRDVDAADRRAHRRRRRRRRRPDVDVVVEVIGGIEPARRADPRRARRAASPSSPRTRSCSPTSARELFEAAEARGRRPAVRGVGRAAASR